MQTGSNLSFIRSVQRLQHMNDYWRIDEFTKHGLSRSAHYLIETNINDYFFKLKKYANVHQAPALSRGACFF